MLRTQPCLALKLHSIPHPRTRALLGGRERTSNGPQHRFLGHTSPAHFSHLQRAFSRLLAAEPLAVLDQPISHLRDSRDRATQTAGTATSWGRSLIYTRTLKSHERSQAGVSRQPVPLFHFERCPVCHPMVHPNQEGSVPALAASVCNMQLPCSSCPRDRLQAQSLPSPCVTLQQSNREQWQCCTAAP